MSTGVTENQANIRSWLRHHQDPQFPISAAFVKYFAQQLDPAGVMAQQLLDLRLSVFDPQQHIHIDDETLKTYYVLTAQLSDRQIPPQPARRQRSTLRRWYTCSLCMRRPWVALSVSCRIALLHPQGFILNPLSPSFVLLQNRPLTSGGIVLNVSYTMLGSLPEHLQHPGAWYCLGNGSSCIFRW